MLQSVNFFCFFIYIIQLGDLKCTESIEEEAKEDGVANVAENCNVHTGRHVNGEQRRSRKRKNVNRKGDKKGKEKASSDGQDGSAEGDEVSQSEEDEFDEEGHDLKFYERVGDTVKGLLTTVEEERIQKKTEKKVNLMQRG